MCVYLRACVFLCLMLISSPRWYTQQNQARARTYSWSRTPHSALDPRHPSSTPVYGHLCYSIHTLPVLRDLPEGPTPFQSGLQLAKLMETYGLPGHQMGNVNNSQVIQNQSTFDLLESGAVPLNPAEPQFPSREGPESMRADSRPTEREGGRETNTDNQQQQQLHPNQGPIRVRYELSYIMGVIMLLLFWSISDYFSY